MVCPSAKLEVDHITKKYPPMRKGVLGFRDFLDSLKGRRQQIVALDDISFDVKPGEWFGLLGPNGAGKTTFCDLLLDITTPTSGHIRLDGRDVNREHGYTRGRVAAMMYWSWHDRVSLRDSLLLAGTEWALTHEEACRRMDFLVGLFDVRDKLDEWVVRLSGGTRMKLDLIATLMSGAEVLVFDEPTARLDVLTRRRLYSQLKEFQSHTNTTIIWTTHNLHEAQATCDRVAVINTRLLAVARPQTLVEWTGKTDLEEAFIALLDGCAPPDSDRPANKGDGV